MMTRCAACAKPHPSEARAPGLAAWRPDPWPRAAGERQHQLVEPAHEGAGVVELTPFGQHRLVEKDMAPIGESLRVGLALEPLYQRVLRIDLQDGPAAG